MKLLQPVICIFLLLNIHSCTKSNLVHFEDKESGWEFDYPEDWHVLSDEEIAASEGRGKEKLESSTGQSLILPDRRTLIYLRKNKTNIFQSVMEPWDATYNGSYEEGFKTIYDMLENFFMHEGWIYDGEIYEEKINGLVFHALKFIVYNEDKSEVIIKQYMFNRLFINKFSLSINISFSDPSEEKTLLDMVHSSHFSIRN